MPASRTRVGMKTRWLALLLVLVAAGCGDRPVSTSPAPSTSSTPVPHGPVRRPGRTAESAAEIEALLGQMAAAVLAGDQDGYLALVDLSDPVLRPRARTLGRSTGPAATP